MGPKLVAFLVLVASMAASATANFNQSNNANSYYYGWGPKPGSNCSQSPSPKEITVGGDNYWRFGFDYSTWAFKNGPFYVNDTLVFKYEPPSENNTHPHSVYVFNDYWSFRGCNLNRAKMVANSFDGSGDGFKFVLAKTGRPYYFACGESNGFHCTNGGMKFLVMPRMRWWKNN